MQEYTTTTSTPTEHTTIGTPPAKRGIKAKHKNKICDCWEIYTQTMKKVKKSLEIRK